MQKESFQLIIDECVSDISETLTVEPDAKVCAWWRGRLSGLVDMAKAFNDDIDVSKANKALDEIIEYEGWGHFS
jgi:hypothetical protein